MKTMKQGFRYRLRSPFDATRPGYCYAEPVDYANDCSIGDCWIVDVRGNIHPGYNCSPVPLNASQLCKPEKISQQELTLNP